MPERNYYCDLFTSEYIKQENLIQDNKPVRPASPYFCKKNIHNYSLCLDSKLYEPCFCLSKSKNKEFKDKLKQMISEIIIYKNVYKYNEISKLEYLVNKKRKRDNFDN